MEPCGTPHVIIVSLYMVPFISVTCVLLVKYDLNHSTVLVSEPIERSLLSKISWLKLSAQPYGQPNAKYVHFCTCTRYLMCT